MDYYVMQYDVSDGHLAVFLCDADGWEIGVMHMYGVPEHRVNDEADALVRSYLDMSDDYALEAMD